MCDGEERCFRHVVLSDMTTEPLTVVMYNQNRQGMLTFRIEGFLSLFCAPVVKETE
jgi:hypothetical protein